MLLASDNFFTGLASATFRHSCASGLSEPAPRIKVCLELDPVSGVTALSPQSDKNCGNGYSVPAFAQEVRQVVADRPIKVAQLVGEIDRERNQPTLNRTLSRYGLYGTDLGVTFRHKGKTYILFGDTDGVSGGDAMAEVVRASPDTGLELSFFERPKGRYQPVFIPGIRQDGFEVPMAGTSVAGKMYVYHTTDHRPDFLMGRSVVAVSEDDGATFRYLYDLSTSHFINVSLVGVDSSSWKGLPRHSGEGLLLFGSGNYRKSDVRLAFQPAQEIESRKGICYFSGPDSAGFPEWSCREDQAQPLFSQPCVGELSVTFNHFIRKWIMLYNCGTDRQTIVLRTSDKPWGPWSDPQVIFDPHRDGGFCHFIHLNWDTEKCDRTHDPGREGDNGDPYGPYQVEDLTTGDENSTTIYFTLSTWNPYTVVLMKTALRLLPAKRQRETTEPSSSLCSVKRSLSLTGRDISREPYHG